MTCLFITPLLIGFFVSIWYTFWIVVAGMIYIGIFKYFTKIGGRKEAAKILGAPGVPLEKAMRRYKDPDVGLYTFLNKNTGLKIGGNWSKSFCEVCHWCGFQVVIRKDSDTDIENPESKAYDIVLLENMSKDYAEFSEKNAKEYLIRAKKREQHIEEVKSKFDL